MNKSIPVFSYAFKVVIDGVTTDDSSQEYFTSIEGLGKYVSKVSSTSSPGGEKGDISFPSNYNTKKLILRRPLMNRPSTITKWCTKALNSIIYDPKQIYIFILNVEHEIVAQWTLHNAYPIFMDVSSVSIEVGNTIIEQIIEIKYNDLTMDRP
jgi:phage tail-like protein